MVREDIKEAIRQTILEAQNQELLPKFNLPEIVVECSLQEEHGDYSSGVAMKIAPLAKNSPLEVAQVLLFRLKEKLLFCRIEIAPPGFINFYLLKEYLQEQVEEVLEEGANFGSLDLGYGQKVQVEFISANPTGPLTVGNARGGPFGDTLTNVLKMAGYKTEKAYYVNDWGNQILALGHSVLKDSEAQYQGDYIDDLGKKISQTGPLKAGRQAAKIIIEEMIKKTVERLGIKYDEWFFESQLHESGEVERILQLLKEKSLLYEKDGAVWFKASTFGDNRDRVLVKKDGAKTYLAGDLAYHVYKFEKKNFNKVIDVWGADHHGDVSGLKAGLSALGHTDKLDIILMQFVTLLERGEKKKMSKRAGVYVAIDDLLKEIGSDAIRFFSLQVSADTHLNFDLALARERSEKNPVYYVQYAYARLSSILRKATAQGLGFEVPVENLDLLQAVAELELIKQLIRLPEIVEDVSKDYQVQRLPQYALELVRSFHKFYEECRVIDESQKELTKVRLSLVEATRIVLKNTLDLMGISAPEKM